jgi:hypothetical protein
MKTLITFGDKLHVNYDTFETGAHDEQDKVLLTESYKDTFDNDVRRATRDLLGRPWFERMWISQEYGNNISNPLSNPYTAPGSYPTTIILSKSSNSVVNCMSTLFYIYTSTLPYLRKGANAKRRND